MADLKFEYEGATYFFDLMRVGVDELRQIKTKMRMTPLQFMEGITQIDVDAMLALKWVILRSDGKHDDLVLGTPDSPFPDYWQFCEAWKDAQKVDEDPDPTQAGTHPATSTPESTSSSTLTSSISSPNTGSLSPDGAMSANGKSDASLTPDSSPTSSASMP